MENVKGMNMEKKEENVKEKEKEMEKFDLLQEEGPPLLPSVLLGVPGNSRLHHLLPHPHLQEFEAGIASLEMQEGH